MLSRWIIVVVFISFCIVFSSIEAASTSLSKLGDTEQTKIGRLPNPRCGPESLLIVSELLGVKVDIEELSKLSGMTDQGTTMYGLHQAAKAIGLSPRGMKLNIADLREAGLPAIIHVAGNHFVALERFIGEDARIIDRSGRAHFLSKDQLAKIWDGTALVISRPETSENKRGPDIEFGELAYNFGEVYQWEDIEYAFKFQNTGTDDLVISLESSCKCTTSLSKGNNISPGESGVVEVEFSTEGRRGITTESVKVHTNDPDEPLIYLTLLGSVKDVPGVIPNQVFFRNVYNKESAQRTIKVIGLIRDGFEITALETTSEHIKAEVTSVKDQQEADILLTLRPDTPIGKVGEKLIIYTNSEKRPKIEVPIEGAVVGGITTFPDRFLFGIVIRGKSTSRRVELSKAGKKNLVITSLKAGSEFVSVKAIPLEQGSKYVLEAFLSEDTPPGTIRDTVHYQLTSWTFL